MKICILLSSYEGTSSPFQEFDEYQDPGIYAKSHQFEKRFVTKENALEQIDQIIDEGFDYIWNFMWGTYEDNVAGIDATEYLESKNVPMIGTSSKYLKMTKLDFRKAFEFAGVRTPKGISVEGVEDLLNSFNVNGLNFPLIVKASNGCGSKHMTSDSVCHNLQQLLKQVELLKSQIQCNVLIEEFIVGEEISIMVLETKDGVVALSPIVYNFPKHWEETQKYFTFDRKWNGVDSGEIGFKLFDEDAMIVERIKEESIKSYIALGVLGSGYARVDVRLRDKEPYFLEVNNTPAFFSYIGNTFGDDFVIESTFQGGHEVFVDTIISSRKRFDAVTIHYNTVANTYNDLMVSHGSSNLSVWDRLFEKFNFDGTVLDLGCGTGLLGNLIQQKYESTLTGIDISVEMAKLVENYEKVHIGLIENVMLELKTTYDHIVTSGALVYCCPQNFQQILTVMFKLATTSITLTLEDISDEYIAKLIETSNAFVFNHSNIIENFPIPSDWKLVHKERDFLWQSPSTECEVYGISIRYEKIKNVENFKN